jgi:hypothetical protein
MAMPGQPPVQGGLGAMAPGKPAPAQKEPSEAQDAARISAMEQDTILSPEEVARKALVDRKAQSQALESQIRLLTQSLDSRMKPSFDAPLMNLAAGLLKPTKTGSFGESLGYGLEGYSKAAQEEAMQKQAIEKQRLEYMQKLAEVQNQQSLTDFDLASLGPQAKTVLRTGAESAPMGAPAPVTQAPGEAGRATPPMVAGAPSAALAGGMEFPQVSRNPMTVDKANLARMMSPDRGKLAYDQLEAERKQMELELKKIDTRRGQIISTPLGMWDTDKQSWVEKDPFVQKGEKFDFGPFNPPGQDGRLASQKQIREYQAIDKNDTNAMIKFAVAQGWLSPSALPPSAGTTPAGGGAAPAGTAPAGGAAPAGKPGVDPLGRPTRIKTPEEIQQEKNANEAALAESKKYAEGAGEMANNLRESAFMASDIKGLAQEASSIAKAAAPAFKLLMNKDDQFRTEFDAYMQMAKTGAQAGQFGSFSIPADVIERNRLTTEQIQALQKFAQIESQFTLFNRRLWLKGQGAVSNGENAVAQQLGPQSGDRPEVIQMKAQAIERKADFDEKTFNAFEKYLQENPGSGFSRFIAQSPEFKALKTDYLADLKAMRESNARYFSGQKAPTAPVPAQAPAATSPSNETFSQRLERIRKEKEKAANKGTQ